MKVKMPRRGKKGFSLIEIMVATTILVLLVGLLSAVVLSIMRVWSAGKANINNQARSRLVLGQICSDLRDSVLRSDLGAFTDATGVSYPLGDLTGSAPFSFYTKRPSIGGTRSLSLVSYRLLSSSGGASLQRADLSSNWTQVGATFGQTGLPNLNGMPNYKDILEDCLRFSVIFQQSDGSLSLSYDPQTTKSAIVVVASLTEQAAPVLKKMGKFNDLQGLLTVPSSQNLDAIKAAGGLRKTWEEELLKPTTVSTYPSVVNGGILLLERTVSLPLPISLPQSTP